MRAPEDVLEVERVQRVPVVLRRVHEAAGGAVVADVVHEHVDVAGLERGVAHAAHGRGVTDVAIDDDRASALALDVGAGSRRQGGIDVVHDHERTRARQQP